MDRYAISKSPCQFVENFSLFGMPIWIKRDDLLHPFVSGNKYRKLKFPLLALEEEYKKTDRLPLVITMGGIWSNHLHATAYATAKLSFPSCGLVRGHTAMQSLTLADCRAQGMLIQFADRINYRALRENPWHWQTMVDPGLIKQHPDQYWLPEGGSDPAALHGVAEIIGELIDELKFIPDAIVVACGTGATLAGLLAGLKGCSRVIGIAVLKNADYLHGEIARLLQQAGYPAYQNYQLLTNFHHGGYGKVSPELSQFCREFSEQSVVPIEQVYSGKVFFALRKLIQSGYFQSHERCVVIHTGGIQGARGNKIPLKTPE
ncbi:MAG: 1-aminocyclopropane-carboxylate deaminase [Solimicrobium sp.]|jgi:1-aminocyclopropane-1-carboxylate deaminase|nr:1-aminocyclopropane-carboxylate deaminase [Solimicrobium sp.]